MATRELLSVVLGVALGVVFLAYPGAVVRLHTVGRMPDGRRGDYGTGGEIPRKWRLLVRGVGVALIAVGAWFGAGAFPQ